MLQTQPIEAIVLYVHKFGEFGYAQTSSGEGVYIHLDHASALFMVGTSLSVKRAEAPFIPNPGQKIVFLSTLPPEPWRKEGLPRAKDWMPLFHFEKMRGKQAEARAKAAETQAKLAQLLKEEEAKRQKAIEASQRKHVPKKERRKKQNA